MKININVDSKFQDTEIIINCSSADSHIEKIAAVLGMIDLKLTGTKDKTFYVLEASDVLYISVRRPVILPLLYFAAAGF